MDVIIADKLSKNYESVTAISEISFSVKSGEIFGLIGPDGAGKTTIMRILTTLILPNSGSFSVSGFDGIESYDKIRRSVGYMPGRFSLYQDLTVEENLNLFASIFNTSVHENYDLIEDIYTHIEPFRKRPAGKLSGGMKQKLALSCALIHKPEVLFLDEPTTGVDAISRVEFWELLMKLKKQGITILISTPYMDEASHCDRVGLIQNGRIFKIDSPFNIIESFPKLLYSIKSDNTYYLLNYLRKYVFCRSVFPFGESVHYTDSRPSDIRDDLTEYLQNKLETEFTVETIKANIEDCFMEFMGRTDE